MRPFQITVHALPDSAKPGPAISLDGRALATLEIAPAALGTPFGISFEEAQSRIERLPRSNVEPDGSLFYGSAAGEPPWHIDGNLFDRNGRLLFVDLKGSLPAEEFDKILSALGWPQTRLVFQLVREAIFLDEPEFRRWAEETA